MSMQSAPSSDMSTQSHSDSTKAAAATSERTASTSAPGTGDTPSAGAEPDTRVTQAEAVIRRNVYWSLGAGAVPIPLVDIAAQTAVELKLLKELATLYQREYSSSAARRIIYSLLSSVGAVGIGSLIGGSLASFIPFVGVPLGIASKSGTAAAFTYGIGRVMLLHFEAGGTLLDFDPAAMRTHFLQEVERGKAAVKQMRADLKKSPAKAEAPAAAK